MEGMLLEKFREYVADHNPELILRNQREYPLSQFTRERVKAVMPTVKYMMDQGHATQEILDYALDEMTKDLRPSKADYIREVFKTEFPVEHHALVQQGQLTYHVVEIIRLSTDVFEAHSFTESSKDSRLLRHAVIVEVHNYITGLKI